MTSPAAKMCGTVVRNCASTVMRPRSSAGNAGVLEREDVRRADAADREERHIGDDALARFERQHRAARRSVADLELLHGFAKSELDVPLSHLVNQLVDDLGVDELERPVAPVDDRDLDAERGEHRRVLDADHAGADDGERARKPLEAADLVARDDRTRRPTRRRAAARPSCRSR